MKSQMPSWIVAAAFAAGLSLPALRQDPAPLEARVQTLEREIAELKKERAQVAELTQKVTAVENYLQGVARSADKSLADLELAVEEGFAWGLNPNAHEAMIRSIRNILTSTKAKVPGVPEPQARGYDPRRSRFERDK